MIPYGRQSIDQSDIDAVVRVLRSDWLTQGPAVPRFEEAIAGYCGARHAVASTSGTSALHLACLALGVGPGDRVWTSPISFIASANCARYCGAEVDFVDIDPRTYNLSIEALEEKLRAAERAGILPKVIIPVHLCGQPCDMMEIHRLACAYGIRIIEDASHAIGATYRDERVGNCRYSDITVFSFHPVKLITTGEGGMCLGNDAELARRMTRLRSHGVTRVPNEMTRETDGPWYYEQLDLGYNYRMTDIQAMLGLSQLSRLDDFLRRRLEIARRYDEALGGLPLTLPWQRPGCGSAFHLYVVRLAGAAKAHRRVFEQLHERGIGVNLHYIPIYRQPYYARLGYRPEDYAQAERYYAEAISLPIYPVLSEPDQEKVVTSLQDILA